jgi:deoxyribose-phosphate aldolase
MDYTYQDISKMIDHALLVPTTTVEDLEAGCRLALTYDVASVCIMPYYLSRCSELLAGSAVKSSTTIGFPHGANTTAIKVAEAQQAITDGCEELDVVVNISKVVSGDWDYVQAEISALVEIAHGAGRKIKIIFENCYLDDSQKIKLCEICSELNADWVKTSTGYGTNGATIDDLKLMRSHSPEHVQVKAAGGVKDMDMMLEVRSMGVSRVGSSRTVSILDDCRKRLNLEPLGTGTSASEGGY